jgi:hypothetical protein
MKDKEHEFQKFQWDNNYNLRANKKMIGHMHRMKKFSLSLRLVLS